MSLGINANYLVEAGGMTLPFEMQPIMRLRDNTVYAYELLYRGIRLPGGWRNIDAALLEHFGAVSVGGVPMFVNLDHENLRDAPEQLLLDVKNRNKVFFEISEEFVAGEVFESVCAKINKLSAMGVMFAIDDFGSGLDGLSRLYALDKVECIKVDGKLFQAAYKRRHARESLSSMVAHWNASGIVTVAEWVENEALLEFATECGFTMGQGFCIDGILAKGDGRLPSNDSSLQAVLQNCSQ